MLFQPLPVLQYVRMLPEHQQQRMTIALQADTLPLLQLVSKGTAQLKYLGATEVVGRKAHALQTTIAGTAVTFFVDAETPDFLGTRYLVDGTLVTTVESEFKAVDGYHLAHRVQVLEGVSVTTVTVTEAAFNPEFPADYFEPLKHAVFK